ncbi:uncharacterized protein C14orf79 homolog [Enhydra lutris kenyoni]|uniref:Uncharacterized protein C14orf79 homolog n=1 Tax=Enhydra lutris kenyoni TaxID=391180 RepID=A0A2Y9JIE7_ENHLU|nr:uncharacterized protein C14orf79 homolog [Enhydra lutris kenyoni]
MAPDSGRGGRRAPLPGNGRAWGLRRALLQRAAVAPGGSDMQGQRQRGAAPGQAPPPRGSPSDPAAGAGDVSLRPASEERGASRAPGGRAGAGAQRLSGERLSWAREGPSPCPAGGPDPAEPGSAWGEFEGFRDASVQSEQFSPNFERPERPPRPQRQTVASTQKERGAGVSGAAGSAPREVFLQRTSASPPHSSEDVFPFVFQDTPVPQATEGISPLNHILEAPGWESGRQLCFRVSLGPPVQLVVPETIRNKTAKYRASGRVCPLEEPLGRSDEPGGARGGGSESRRLWRALQSTDGASASRSLWSGSRCQENLFLVLGIDAAQKNPSGDLGHILECSDLKQSEDLGVPAFSLRPCGARIQTKLPGTSGGRQGGSRAACSVFLKTPLPRNGQYVTIPWKKKMFNPRNLKMTLFNSDVC